MSSSERKFRWFVPPQSLVSPLNAPCPSIRRRRPFRDCECSWVAVAFCALVVHMLVSSAETENNNFTERANPPLLAVIYNEKDEN
ncbi:hypothetical protein EVAR_6116_1 [Eumeta japonica]|uniref:Uncharacterized protein n=1 Tax=Eumeta variegata TaxID=151549 RepID=A0A4C1TGU2_EUMVA|nr:hypothetical protein EVAR_6116_1 [Eumeta japonica]